MSNEYFESEIYFRTGDRTEGGRELLWISVENVEHSLSRILYPFGLLR